VPIGALQLTLLELATDLDVSVRYDAEIVKVHRHRWGCSLQLADGPSLRAGLAIVTTGAGRALVDAPAFIVGGFRRLIGGVFIDSAEAGQWVRMELPVSGFRQPIRFTALYGGPIGTALIVDGPLSSSHSDRSLRSFFRLVAEHLKLDELAADPLIFRTQVSALTRRTIEGDGKAPVIIAGDAAQTGHVFTGQVGMFNLALGLRLAELLDGARTEIVQRAWADPALLNALERYDRRSDLVATVFRQSSAPHLERRGLGQWAEPIRIAPRDVRVNL
jgi:2-polyprenyl-6-methoxyphenol hydroxylase-like FAD-dependent oxidoreductase